MYGETNTLHARSRSGCRFEIDVAQFTNGIYNLALDGTQHINNGYATYHMCEATIYYRLSKLCW
jgi:hypothetical protein